MGNEELLEESSSLETPLLANDYGDTSYTGTTEELRLVAAENGGDNGNDITTTNIDNEDHDSTQSSPSSSSSSPPSQREVLWRYYLHCTLLPDRPWTSPPFTTSTTSSANSNDNNDDGPSAPATDDNIGYSNNNNNNQNDTDQQQQAVNNSNNDEGNSSSQHHDDNSDDEDNNNDDDDGIDIDMATTATKLLKFLTLTFFGIFFLHWIVSHRTTHRDVYLRTWKQFWVFQGNLIVRDTIAFFWVGRLWNQRGVDHLAWILVVVLSNIFMESQHYIAFLRHSATLFQMHCVWPWQLWAYVVLGILPVVIGVTVAHVRRAVLERTLGIRLMELALSALFFLAPVATSPYFHFHHWFAGWLVGMHCNCNVWWSRAAMAWCWGLYINGIAVYGRDPVLTCEYAEFLTKDMRCPFGDMTTTTSASTCEDLPSSVPDSTSSSIFENGWSGLVSPLYTDSDMPPPVDWRNCSSNGYHP